MKVEWLSDWWLDPEWRFADDPLVAHARPPCPHLEQQLVHHVEVVHVHRLRVEAPLPERPCR